MVYNPPVLKDADGGEEPVVVTVNPQRSGDAYIEQAVRGAAWVSLLVICWLLQRLMCHFGLPPHCDLPSTALEVLTDFLTLVVFGLTQVRESNQQAFLGISFCSRNTPPPLLLPIFLSIFLRMYSGVAVRARCLQGHA